MRDLNTSFKQHVGFRGVHVYSEEGCKFLAWDEIVAFVASMPDDTDPEFGDKLLEKLANYDPDHEFLALQQYSNNLTIEVYTPRRGKLS